MEVLAARYPVRTGLIAAVRFGGVAALAVSTVTWGVVLWGVGVGTGFFRLAGHLRPDPIGWATSAVIAIVPMAIGVLSGFHRARASRLPRSED